MRNYIWISEFKNSDQVYNLGAFDDEFFIILRNNQPIYIAFPTTIDNEFDARFNFEPSITSARNLIQKWISLEDGNILHVIKDNKKYYNIIPFWREESCFIEDVLLSKTREQHFSILNNK